MMPRDAEPTEKKLLAIAMKRYLSKRTYVRLNTPSQKFIIFALGRTVSEVLGSESDC